MCAFALGLLNKFMLLLLCVQGGCVLQIDPKRGTCLRELVLPTTQVTSVAFGGPTLEDLYITTAREDIPAEKLSQPGFMHAGKLFRVTGLGAKGVPAAEFKVDAAVLRAAQATSVVSIVPTVETIFKPQVLRA